MVRITLPLALLAGLVFHTAASAQVTLEHKFPDGATSTAVTDVKTDQTLTLAGTDILTKSEQTVTVVSTNGTRDADGQLTVMHKIEALKVDLSVAGIELSFDSAKPDAEPPGTQLDFLIDMFKATTKSEWTVVHDKDNSAISVKGRDKFLEDLPEQLRTASAKQLDPEYLTEQANHEMARIPSNPLSPGDTWDLTSAVRLDSGQTMTFKTSYTYEGTIDKDGKSLDKISVETTEVIYAMDADSPSPLKYVSSELKISESSGAILFDRQLGMVVDSTDKKHITGEVKFEVDENEMSGKLDLTMETHTSRR